MPSVLAANLDFFEFLGIIVGVGLGGALTYFTLRHRRSGNRPDPIWFIALIIVGIVAVGFAIIAAASG